jgi:hypothetical protein
MIRLPQRSVRPGEGVGRHVFRERRRARTARDHRLPDSATPSTGHAAIVSATRIGDGR